MIEMSRNPFVDGITNVAIPDSPNGVDLSNHNIIGNLYGHESVIRGNVNLESAKIGGNVYFDGMIVEEGYGLEIKRYSSKTSDMEVTSDELIYGGDVNLQGAEIKGDLHLQDAKITGTLVLPQIVDGIYLIGAEIARLHVNKDIEIRGLFDLSNARIADYFGPDIFGVDNFSYDEEALTISLKLKHALEKSKVRRR